MFSEEVVLSDSTSLQKKSPLLKTPSKMEIVALLTIRLIQVILFYFLFISGKEIIPRYMSILSGVMPDEIEKTILDYSMTIFAGCAICLLLYMDNVKEWIRKMTGTDKN